MCRLAERPGLKLEEVVRTALRLGSSTVPSVPLLSREVETLGENVTNVTAS